MHKSGQQIYHNSHTPRAGLETLTPLNKAEKQGGYVTLQSLWHAAHNAGLQSSHDLNNIHCALEIETVTPRAMLQS